MKIINHKSPKEEEHIAIKMNTKAFLSELICSIKGCIERYTFMNKKIV